MSTAPTTIFRTLVVHEPSAPSSSPHSPTPSIPGSSTAVENLSKLPGGLWALLILVAAALVSGIVWFVYITNKKKKKEEEKGEEGSKPNETEGIPLDTLTVAAAMTPQAALNFQWLRESQGAAKPARPLPVILPPAGPNAAPPDPASLTGDEVKFIPLPPGYDLPPPPAPAPPAPAPVVVSAASPPPRPQKRDPAGVSATTTVRNIGHGFKKSIAAVAPPA
ncbi:hypothetical protein N7465_011531 [Penicillium sp. CMV-2018d]|nr:hypothetical protein N7465_011531 [Penicillium sp. CMV-2018d]